MESNKAVKRELLSALFVCLLPALLVCFLYYFCLGFRRDYLGHYAAGYGGTLGALSALMAAMPQRQVRWSSVALLLGTLLCIAAGTVAEATVFRLAKFDEVDYCNQNLGALLAGLAVLQLVRDHKPTDAVLTVAVTIGAVFLIVGTYYAVT